MEQRKITISQTGEITIPATVQMSSYEIAELLGVCTRTITVHIKAILKAGVVDADIAGEAVVEGNQIIPLSLGLDMIIALAFRIDSPTAKRFREWVVFKTKAGNSKRGTVVVQLSKSASIN